ncbi:hypothetical protein COO60DRAFT_917083 [Scenedesmus sp. NREL 46B-D3]|nr:hypothetical protein COO60DRAFT_917083 [Scenedesmus sp. NREL 46B-D3]
MFEHMQMMGWQSGHHCKGCTQPNMKAPKCADACCMLLQVRCCSCVYSLLSAALRSDPSNCFNCSTLQQSSAGEPTASITTCQQIQPAADAVSSGSSPPPLAMLLLLLLLPCILLHSITLRTLKESCLNVCHCQAAVVCCLCCCCQVLQADVQLLCWSVHCRGGACQSYLCKVNDVILHAGQHANEKNVTRVTLISKQAKQGGLKIHSNNTEHHQPELIHKPCAWPATAQLLLELVLSQWKVPCAWKPRLLTTAANEPLPSDVGVAAAVAMLLLLSKKLLGRKMSFSVNPGRFLQLKQVEGCPKLPAAWWARDWPQNCAANIACLRDPRTIHIHLG